MRIRKIKHIEPNMSKVIGINDSPNDKDVYSSNAIIGMVQQDIVTNGEAVKCGYKIDGKDVYIKRYSSTFTENNASFEHGLDLSTITILKIEGTYNNSTNDFPLPSIRNGYADYQTEFYHNNGTIVISVANVGRDGYTAYVDIYFVYKN